MADPRQGRPSESDVREVVRRIVEATVAPAPPASTVPPSSAAAPPSPSPAPVTGAAPVAADRPAIAVGGDHGGFALKEAIRRSLEAQGYRVHDCGTHSEEAVDYPDIAHAVARLVADGTCGAGIVVDGAGIGSAMAANKVPGVRAALCYDLSTARNAREHNHANVLTLGARLVGAGLAQDIVAEWLATPWGPGRHAARVDKITEIERRYGKPTAGDGSR
ncbi:MAG: ribose 5-phosphate isomerase B [Chloroflexota bacterium]